MITNKNDSMNRAAAGRRVPVKTVSLPEPPAEWELLREILLGEELAHLHELDGENHALRKDLVERWQRLHEDDLRMRHENHQLQETQKNFALELARLKTNLEDKEALLASLQPVVADLLERKIADSGEEMAEIVAPLMGPAIKKQVSESKDEVVEALYPVIGQTVRRAVAEAMRKLVRQINARLDKAFNLHGTWARWKARLTGVPQPLVLLPQVFPFSVEQLFLIDQRTGLLLAHEACRPADGLRAEGELPVDEEGGAASDGDGDLSESKPQMISGMLTAIQDFVRDAFGAPAAGDLHEIKYGDRVIFVAASPPVFLAAVTLGAAPLQFPERLRGFLRRLHNAFHQAFHTFQGDTAALASTRPVLQKFLAVCNTLAASTTTAKAVEPAQKTESRWTKMAWGAAGGFALAVISWFVLKSALPTSEPLGESAPAPTALAPGTAPFRLEMRTSGEVWLRIFDERSDSTDFRFQPGEVFAWRAYNTLRLRVGNAGQTQLFVDGKDLGHLGELHQPVTLVISRKGIVERR